ncbi:MAG: threonylcarbamoyl-AMP synthase [Chlamydiae bacterium]|nr:threonylcarbamoyl-AMP synthase [Chlamydiota bacterium]
MKTQILFEKDLAFAADLLKKGEVVAFPTETVYGLGASIFRPDAIEKIFQAKKRPRDNPLIAHISGLHQIETIAVEIPDFFYRLAETFFPGPLTLVVKKHPNVPKQVSGSLDTIAIRFPNHPIAQKLISLVGVPLVAPSANLSGRPSPTEANHVLQDLEGRIAAIIDGGICKIGLESTVIDLVSSPSPILLRPGKINRKEVEEVLGVEISTFSHSSPISSPGVKYKHYAPNAQVKVWTDQKSFLKDLKQKPNPKRMVLSRERIEGCGQWFSLSSHNFYSLLRLADQNKMEEIIIFCDDAIQENEALMNRISKI